MQTYLLPVLSGLILLSSSCGSHQGDLANEETPIEAAEEQSTAPRLIFPPSAPRPIAQVPPPSSTNLFRVPTVTNELPEETSLLNRPVSAPLAPSSGINAQ